MTARFTCQMFSCRDLICHFSVLCVAELKSHCLQVYLKLSCFVSTCWINSDFLSISDHIGHTSLFCPGVLFACDSLRFLSFLLQNYIYHKNISFLDEHVPYVSLHEPFVKTIDCISDSCASLSLESNCVGLKRQSEK